MLHAAALFYFREVARVGSIRKAAASLNVAASALNRQIINLEIRLGTPLFDRLPGSMRLTVAGDLLLRHVVDTLHDFDRVRGAYGHGVLVSGRALALKGRLAEDRHGFVLRTPSLTR